MSSDRGAQKRKPARRLDSAERIEAVLLAEEMVMKRCSDRAIVSALREHYLIAAQTARKILRDAVSGIQDQVAKSRPHRRAQQIASLDRLYERCLDQGKLSTAVRVQALLAKIEGTEKPTKHVHTGIPAAASAVVGEFADRSVEDLDYYAGHGHWPEEAVDQEVVQGKVSGSGDSPEFPLH